MAGNDHYNILLLHGNAYPFTDSSSYARGTTGNFVDLEETIKKFGAGSINNTNAAAYLTIENSADFAFGTESVTIDCWFYMTSLATVSNFIGWSTAASGVQFFYDSSDDKFKIYAFAGILMESTTGLVAINEWHHYAYVRNGNNHRIYIDGANVAETTSTGSYGTPNHANKIKIGAETTVPSQNFRGYLDEFRISRGIARWTADTFTPPTAEYSTDYVSVYPPASNATYVVASSDDTDYKCYYCTDMTKSLVGVASGNSWRGASHLDVIDETPTLVNTQRINVDLGAAKIVRNIQIANYHRSGLDTTFGAKNFILSGSNDVDDFNDFVCNHTGTWTNLTTSASLFAEHAASDTADIQNFTVTNYTAYRYYSIYIADTYGSTDFNGLRRLVFQIDNLGGSGFTPRIIWF